MKKSRGMSLIEALVTLVVISLFLAAIIQALMTFRIQAGEEQARVRRTQESRFMFTSFFSQLTTAGALLANARTYTVSVGILDPSDPNQYIPFNGIFPLNNTDWPDGLIVACGDPDCVSRVISGGPTNGNVTLEPPVGTPPNWLIGDRAILLGPNGYFVLRVTAYDAGIPRITFDNAAAIYYSGLLNTAHYLDQTANIKGVSGLNALYPSGSMVIRLTDFAIYMTRQVVDTQPTGRTRTIRELVVVNDCMNLPNALENNNIVKNVVTRNLWDMQIVYTQFPLQPGSTNQLDLANPVYFFTNEPPRTVQCPNPNVANNTSSDLNTLLSLMDRKLIKEVTFHILALTEDYPGPGSFTYNIPAFADLADGYTLPTNPTELVKFHYRVFPLVMYPKNFNVKI